MAIQLFPPSIGIAASYMNCYPVTGLGSTQSAYTMTMWVNFPVVPTTVISMFGFYDGTSSLLTLPTTAIQMGTRGAGVLNVWTWGGGILVDSTFTIVANTWIHFAYTVTAISGGTQVHNVYINGILNATSTNANQIAGTFTQFQISGYPEITHQAETGNWYVDDARCFTRTLSADEIMTMYTTRGPCDGIVQNSICRYDMSEGFIGNTVANGTNGAIATYDLSGLNNHLILIDTTISPTPTYVVDWADRYDRPCHS